MASRIEVSKIVLPTHVEEGIAKVYDAAIANQGGSYGRVSGDLNNYMLDTVLEDESVHPVAKASLAASVSSSLVGVGKEKYHPIPATQRKLTAMRAFLGSMRPESIVLLKADTAIRNTEDPQLVGDTYLAPDSSYPRIQSSVTFRVADIARVNVGLADPLDIGLSRNPLGAKDGVITVDGTTGSPEHVLKYLTGVDQYGDNKISGSARIGVARDGELYDYIEAMSAEEPGVNTPVAYPPPTLNALGASVAVMAVSERRRLAVPVMTHEELRQEFRSEISHTIVSLAMRESHREGVDEISYCCPTHGNKTYFRTRRNEIARWTTEQLGIVLACLNLTVDDLIPERKQLGSDSAIGEVISDVINHDAVAATIRELRIRLSKAGD